MVAVYGSTGNPHLSSTIEANNNLAAIICYGDALTLTTKPQLIHASRASTETIASEGITLYCYQARSPQFVIPGHEDFSSASAAVSHTRSLTFLKKHMGGPIFDLEAIWEEHTEFEFGNRSVENTIGTMVQEPYVNHIPTVHLDRLN